MNVRMLVLMLFTIMSSDIFCQEIGLEMYSLRNELKTDVPGAFAKVKNWGIQEIETIGTYGLSYDELKALVKKNNLTIISVSADFQKLAEKPQESVDHAKALGAKYVVVFWIPHPGDEFGVAETQKAIEVFNTAGKLLKENGISLCYHPHGYEFRPYEQGTLFDYMVQKTNPQYVNFELDVYWVKQPGQDPVALMNKYPKRFLLLHLKDRKPGTEGNLNGKGDPETNVVLGQGDIDIAAVMKTAKKIGIKHYFLEDESSRTDQQIPESLAYLKNLK